MAEGSQDCMIISSSLAESSATIDLSVILPTYNRVDTLKRTLVALEDQDAPGCNWEVVIADDGSPDDTAEYLKSFVEKTPLSAKVILIYKNGGPARARNYTLTALSGRIVVIIGDDIEVPRDFVSLHMKWHTDHPEENDAVLGRVTWPDKLGANSFMTWLEDGGRQFFFNYKSFSDGSRIGVDNFYTCNVSLKASLLKKAGIFDESFIYASHEDLELGMRLGGQGMALYYQKELIAYHWHYLTVVGIARRVYLMGYSANLYWQKVVDDSPSSRKIARRMIRSFVGLLPCWPILTRLLSKTDLEHRGGHSAWKRILTLSYWIGMSDAANERPPRLFPEQKEVT